VAKLTGKNKEYIEGRIPHLSRLLVDDLNTLIGESDVIIISNNENEFKEALKQVSGKIIIDMVRLSEHIGENNTYIGINW
jgi:GDP-mannose 6-dehydrogenase